MHHITKTWQHILSLDFKMSNFFNKQALYNMKSMFVKGQHLKLKQTSIYDRLHLNMKSYRSFIILLNYELPNMRNTTLKLFGF